MKKSKTVITETFDLGKKPKTQAKDMADTAIKVGLSAIPIVGGPAAYESNGARQR